MRNKIHILGPTYIDHTIRLSDHISLDGSSRIEGEQTYLGGTGLCYALALSRLENEVVLHSVIGTDDKAERIRKNIVSERKLKAKWQVIDGPTDYAYVLIDKGNHKTVASRKIITNQFRPEGITNNTLQDAKAVVLTSFRNETTLNLLKRIPNENEGKPFVMWAPHLPNCTNAKALVPYLSNVDHITLSAEEFHALHEQIGNPLEHGVKSITVTNGKNGCDMITTECLRHFNAVHVVENPLDTNGAGEAFGAGFLTVFLDTGDHETAVRAGSYLGFLHVHRRGSDFPIVSRRKLLHVAKLASSNGKLPLETLMPIQ